MNICALCKENEANQTGSHVISHFLLNSTLSEWEGNNRDRGMLFMLDAKKGSDFEIGRSVLPEEIEVKLRKDVVLAKNKKLLTFDHIFCSTCEKKMGVLENKASRIIETNNLQENQETLKLFLILQIWRCSIVGYGDLKLANKLSESMRYSISEMIECPESFQSMDYILLLKVPKETKTSGYIIMNSRTTAPYYFIINDFAIVWYRKKKNLRTKCGFHGLEECFNSSDFRKKSFLFGEISFDQMKVVEDSLIKNFTNDRISNLVILTKSYFSRILKRYISNDDSLKLTKMVINEIPFLDLSPESFLIQLNKRCSIQLQED